MIFLKRDEKEGESSVERMGRREKEDSIVAPDDTKNEECKEESNNTGVDANAPEP